MKFGDELIGTISSFDDKGRGILNESPPIAVPFAAPDDEVQVTLARREHHTWIGRIQKIIVPSPQRVAAPCPHAGVCGGCLWQHLAYDAQLQTKKDMINRAFASKGHTEQIENVLPSPEQLYYRNRMDYAIGWKGEIGLKEYGTWNRYLNLSTCLLLDEETSTILQIVRDLMDEFDLTPWDVKKHTGLMRYVVIRLGKNTKERMIILVVHDLKQIDERVRKEIVTRLAPLSTTLYLGENPEITDLSYAKNFELLHGNEFLTEEVNGLRYVIHPNSFFQTNTRMAGELQKTVLSFLGDIDHQHILDLYCGLGFFGIACAKQGATVAGLELDRHAIELAKKNAQLNGVEKLTDWRSGPTEKVLPELIKDRTPDAIILDPPRAGLHPKVIEQVLALKPATIIYVSCNYHQLAKELIQFKTLYRVERLTALDLFPQTPHVEVITKLVLSSSHD